MRDSLRYWGRCRHQAPPQRHHIGPSQVCRCRPRYPHTPPPSTHPSENETKSPDMHRRSIRGQLIHQGSVDRSGVGTSIRGRSIGQRLFDRSELGRTMRGQSVDQGLVRVDRSGGWSIDLGSVHRSGVGRLIHRGSVDRLGVDRSIRDRYIDDPSGVSR